MAKLSKKYCNFASMKDFNFQLAIVILLFVGAAIYLVRRTIKRIRAKNCDGDCHCSPSAKVDLKKTKS